MEQTRYIMDNLILKKGMAVPPAPLRRWLRDGYVKLLSARHKTKLKKRWMILFSDVLLLTEKEERKGGDEKKKVRRRVVLCCVYGVCVYVCVCVCVSCVLCVRSVSYSRPRCRASRATGATPPRTPIAPPSSACGKSSRSIRFYSATGGCARS